MSRIKQTFESLKKQGKTALIPFITAGDPSLEITKSLVLEMEFRGADIIELGVPFSDPLADGPTIQASSERALKKGVSLKKILCMIGELRKKTKIPLVLMTYYNPVRQFGLANFVQESVKVAVDGIIIPDLSPEEGRELKKKTCKKGIDVIFLLAPTSNAERIKLITKETSGFLYYVSLTGVTGARDKLSTTVKSSLDNIRGYTKKPLAVGFGISKPEQAKEVASWADGVIVGSALVKIIEKNQKNKNLVKLVGNFIEELSQAMGKKS